MAAQCDVGHAGDGILHVGVPCEALWRWHGANVVSSAQWCKGVSRKRDDTPMDELLRISCLHLHDGGGHLARDVDRKRLGLRGWTAASVWAARDISSSSCALFSCQRAR